MKVAFLTDSFTIGGGLEYIRLIAAGLPQHTFVICARGGTDTECFRQLPNVVLERGGYGPAIIRRHAPELLHFNHLRPLVAHCLRPGPLLLPSIDTVHGIHLRRYDFLHGPHHRLFALARRALERHCLAKTDLTIALTESDRSYLAMRLGVRRIEVIPNGIAPLASAPGGLPLERSARIHFLTPARFHFQKGHEILLYAVALAQDKLRTSGCQFDLVGDGPLRPSMEELAANLRIVDLVHFHGVRADVPRWLASTDCVILPSRWEGLPFALLEAGRHARDVICSDACGNRDVADGGRCALLFRNEDAQDLAAKLTGYLSGNGCGLGPLLRTRIEAMYAINTMLERLDAAYRRLSCVTVLNVM